MSESKQEYTFQAEIKQLLHLLSESLYQNREITLRELVSNASDALDKMRYIQLTEEKYRDEKPLGISIEPDKENNTLSICDNGIGLTRDDLVQNLGTIARSGSLEFLKALGKEQKADVSLIGQFGVGFYSSFMLAENVEVITHSYSEDSGWRWESDGSGRFTIEAADDAPERGTRVKLHLKKDLDEFTEPARLKHIVKKYSTFVPHPIKLEGEQLNDQRPIWVEPKSQVTDEQYTQFYQHLSHHSGEEPQWHLHLSADSPIQFNAILYCPQSNFELLGFGRNEHGISLCAKRILVQDDNRDLLPEYLRFLYGLVDSADLPLNVSREALQDNTIFRKIRVVLTKRILDHLEKFADEDAEKYQKFHQEFGGLVREGIGSDYDNREKIAGLLRFRSSQSTEPTSLNAYLERAGEDQKQIYYLGGPDLASIEKNPNLEIFRKKKLEVLFLSDPMDEVALSHLMSYKDHPLTSIDAADLELPESQEKADEGDESQPDEEDTSQQEPPAGFEKVLTLFRMALGDQVEDVRRSNRLTDSPCCLVNPKGGMSTQIQKMMHLTNRDFEMGKRIFEVNPFSKLIKRLSDLSANSEHDAFIQDCARQLHSNAMLLEGLAPDAEAMLGRVQSFMEELATKRSPIVT